MRRIVLASSNQGKLAELRDLLGDLDIELIAQSELGISDADETEDRDRDLVHGEGGTIDLPTRPGDLSKDD